MPVLGSTLAFLAILEAESVPIKRVSLVQPNGFALHALGRTAEGRPVEKVEV